MPHGIGAKHTACRPGKTVIVKLRNGATIEDVFVERKGHQVIILKKYGRIHQRDIRSFAVKLKRAAS